MALSEAVLAEARANPWPFAKGHGHLHVQWKNGLDGNKQCLDAAILRGEFSAAQALHRLTVGMLNLDGSRNGPQRPTLSSKWASGGRAAAAVSAHVEALRLHLAQRVAADIARAGTAGTAAGTAGTAAGTAGTAAATSDGAEAIDLTASDDEPPPPPPPAALQRDGDAASLALARRLQADESRAEVPGRGAEADPRLDALRRSLTRSSPPRWPGGRGRRHLAVCGRELSVRVHDTSVACPVVALRQRQAAVPPRARVTEGLRRGRQPHAGARGLGHEREPAGG